MGKSWLTPFSAHIRHFVSTILEVALAYAIGFEAVRFDFLKTSAVCLP